MTTHTAKETPTDNQQQQGRSGEHELQDREYLDWLKNTHSPHAEAHERHIKSLSSKLGVEEEEPETKPESTASHAASSHTEGFSKKK